MPGVSLDSALDWVWDLLVMATSFQHWPDGDPDRLRALGDAWTDFADTIHSGFSQMNQCAEPLPSMWRGDAGTAFIEGCTAFIQAPEGGPQAFIAAAYDYANACESTALNLEFSQLFCEIIVTFTAMEIAIALAFSEFGGEAFLPIILATARAALRPVLETLAEQMAKVPLQAAIKKAAQFTAERGIAGAVNAGVRGGLTFGGADLLAQDIQIDEGHRQSLDWWEIGSSFVGGATAGVVATALGGALLRPVLGRLERSEL